MQLTSLEREKQSEKHERCGIMRNSRKSMRNSQRSGMVCMVVVRGHINHERVHNKHFGLFSY